jgi:hypothetical protein
MFARMAHAFPFVCVRMYSVSRRYVVTAAGHAEAAELGRLGWAELEALDPGYPADDQGEAGPGLNPRVVGGVP